MIIFSSTIKVLNICYKSLSNSVNLFLPIMKCGTLFKYLIYGHTCLSSCEILIAILRKEITSVLHTHTHTRLRDSGHIQENLTPKTASHIQHCLLLPFHLFLISDLLTRNNSYSISLYCLFY